MNRRNFSVSMVSVAVTALTGCFDESNSSASSSPSVSLPQLGAPFFPPVGPELATPTALVAATMFFQTIEATDGDSSAAPNQANCWELQNDFGLFDGNDDQFDGVLALQIDVGGTTTSFPSDQAYEELTTFGPELGADDGVKTVSFTTDTQFVVSGTTSAILHTVSDARLQQILYLSSAVGHALNLTWTGQDSAGNFSFQDPYFFQVVVRDVVSGAILSTIYKNDSTGSTGTWGTGSLTAYAGQTVLLSFEQRSTSSNPSKVDDVSVIDSTTNNEYVINGGFETGGTGWTVPAVKVSQNATSGVRTLNGLDVKRSFFTVPNQLWARSTDEYYNSTSAPITAVVSYFSNLGSDGAGITYATPGATSKALTSYDGNGSDRDLGFVFGSADTVTFVSATALQSSNGSDQFVWTFNISVPAGGRVTLVNFTVLTGTDTGKTAVDTTVRATQVDVQNADIANNFRTNFVYQRGMTQVQLDTLVNF